MKSLDQLLASIQPLDGQIKVQAGGIIDGLVKPIGSLGRIETLAVQLSGIYRCLSWSVAQKKIIVMAADHGVFDENVAVSPKSVTSLQAKNTVLGLTGVCAMASATKTMVTMIDAGIDAESIPGIQSIKLNRGSHNIAQGPAMSYEEARTMLYRSALLAIEDANSGTNVIGVGELGVANTTAASAIVSVMTGVDVEGVVGLGANLPSSKKNHKIDVVRQAIKINRPNREDPIDVLAKVGGYDLAGMAGLMIGCAYARIPVVLDGFLSYAAALIAYQLNPNLWHYLIPSHYSAEKGTKVALAHLDIKPYFDLEMRLGEGSGAALAMSLIDAAYHMFNNMGTLAENGLTDLPRPQ